MHSRNILISYILIHILFFSAILQAQESKVSREYKRKYDEAQFYYQYDNFLIAFPLFLELYMSDSLNPELNYKLGICYFNTVRDFTGAQKYFEKAKEKFIDSYFYLGRIEHRQQQLDKAIEAYQYYKAQKSPKAFDNDFIDYYLDKSETAKILIAKKQNVEIRNIGKPVNTPFSEYVPVISSDESILLFTSRREGSIGNLKDPKGEYFEDIYQSFNRLGQWTDPINIGPPVNSETHDACISLSQDGQTMFMYRTNKDLTGGDIYITKFIDGKWTNPEIMQSEINSPGNLQPSVCLSPDETVLYFSSNRPGGYGGLDLYLVRKLPNGSWGPPTNLGLTINTSYDEDSPFIHPDGKILYFSSRGHENMGEFDIFKSELLDEDQLWWSAPENLGYPINTVGDDIYFVVSADAKHGYFSSNRPEGFSNADIYFVTMELALENRVLLKGTVSTNEPVFKTLKATIIIIDNEKNELQGIYRTNIKTGKYLLVLIPGKKYKMTVEAEGYHSNISEIDLTKRAVLSDLNKHINLEPIISSKIDVIKIEKDSIEKVRLDSIQRLSPDSIKINH